MSREPEVLALIPARSGSKRIPDKNIRPFRGQPLLAHSILHALGAEIVSRVVVSTDSEVYADLARAFGAEVPFLRPRELAEDLSTDLQVFDHALRWLDEHEGYRPEICVQLRPTFPHRSPSDIDRAVQLLIDHREADSVRSVVSRPPDPSSGWHLGKDGILRAAYASSTAPRAPHVPPETADSLWVENGAVNAVRTEAILSQRSLTGRLALGYVMSAGSEIKDWIDFELAQSAVLRAGEPPTGLVFVFDLDGVIATLVPENRYENAGPEIGMIAIVNRLYDAGNRIVVHTARGSVTGIDWRAETERQLRAWGLRYHELQFGKPAGDFYIDDRSLSIFSLRAWIDAEL